MKTRTALAVSAVLLTIFLTVPMLAQGRGRGFGYGAGRQGAAWAGRNPGAGWGVGRGPGGWWTRVTPSTPEQEAFLKQVTDIHNQIRTLNWEIAALRAANGPADEIARKEKQIADLRAELAKVTAANEKLLREMGVPAPFGVCTGQGPAGKFGRGAGWGGFGGGRGFGPRNGTGPNPYCPLKRP